MNDKEEKIDEFLEDLGDKSREEQFETLFKTQIMAYPGRTIDNLLEDTVYFSEVERKNLLDLRNKINRELEDEEGLTMSEENIMDTKVKNLTGVEAAKGIKMISEHVERDLQDER
jgi:hypothetical protein